MLIESQVCTIEQAKQLKEFGIHQDNVYYWYVGSTAINTPILLKRTDMKIAPADMCYSGFTCAELGMMLPNGYFTYPTMWSNSRKRTFHAFTDVGVEECIRMDIDQPCDNEAELRARILIHLINAKVISVKEINESLAHQQTSTSAH